MSVADTLRIEVAAVSRLAVPVFLSLLSSTVASIVDTVVLGRYNTDALATFAVAFGVFGPATAVITGTVRGITPFVSERSDQPQALATVVRDGLRLTLLIGLLGAAALVLLPSIARLAGAPEPVVQGLNPLRWLLVAALLVAGVGHAATFILTALNKRRAVLTGGLIGGGVTCLLSPVLVNGPFGLWEGGVNGAGLSLLIAMAAQSLWLCRSLASVVGGYPVLIGVGTNRQGSGRALLRIAAVGLPTASSALIKFGTFGYLTLVASGIGTTAAAAHSISDNILRLTFTAAVAVGMATVPPVARAAAARDRSGVLGSAGAGLLTAAVVLVSTVLVGLVARDTVLGIYTSDPHVEELARRVFPLLLLVLFLDGTQAVTGFALTGLKHTLPSLVMFAVVMGGLVVAAPLLADDLGLSGIWAGLMVANIALVLGQAAVLLRRAGRLPHAMSARFDGP